MLVLAGSLTTAEGTMLSLDELYARGHVSASASPAEVPTSTGPGVPMSPDVVAAPAVEGLALR